MGTTPIYAFPFPALSDAPDGPIGIEDLALGVETELARMDTVPTRVVYTSNDTWTKPTGLRAARVRVVGGGGAGAGAATTGVGEASAGGGGGSGGYAETLIAATSLAATVAVTIGAGGTGAAGAAGGDGGNSSFGAHAVGDGGGGSQTVIATGSSTAWATGGSGGTASVATGVGVAVTGSDGFFGQRISTAARGGSGGPSLLSGSQRPSNTTSTAGFTGQAYGGGGSGANTGASTAQNAGGNGAAGIVIVDHYF